MKPLTRRLLLVLLLGIATNGLLAQQKPGLAIGVVAPALEGRDQTGRRQTLSSLTGRNGLVILFFRSADW